MQDYLQQIDVDIWMHGMANESIDAPFYSQQFAEAAERLLLQNFGLYRHNITTTMCKLVYIFLINNM